ncbi:unnamed protein product [Cuscuta campestris]|uniref:DUF4005 domain-containing protein n=1 Tax=Cuscuta campestris TaxID=132261 RepID=A0A484KXM5_9ASTE|nr:unnamed protein product [Cuscuta campestris]
MGKATRWLKRLLAMKVKKRWAFRRTSDNEPDSGEIPVDDYYSPCRLMTSNYVFPPSGSEKSNSNQPAAKLDGGCRGKVVRHRESFAALRIQTFFRGYLARKALRALKGIVKLQALIRGYLVRKRAAATLYYLEALIRSQAAARSERSRRRLSPVGKCEPTLYNKLNKSSRTWWRSTTDDVSDSGEDYNCPYQPPSLTPGRLSIPDRRRLCESEWRFLGGGGECKFLAANNSPLQSRRRYSPGKCVGGDAWIRPYSDCPGYMANTQSFTAKLRSLSAPKQRPEPRQKKRFSLSQLMDVRSSFGGGGGGAHESSCYLAQQEYGYLGL